jgi:hypothetical protein
VSIPSTSRSRVILQLTCGPCIYLYQDLPRPSSLGGSSSTPDVPPPQSHPSPYPQTGYDQSQPKPRPIFDQLPARPFDPELPTSLNHPAATSDLRLEPGNLPHLDHQSFFASHERFLPPEPYSSNRLSPLRSYDSRPLPPSSTSSSTHSPYQAHQSSLTQHPSQHQYLSYGQPVLPSSVPAPSLSSAGSPQFALPPIDALSRTSTSSTRDTIQLAGPSTREFFPLPVELAAAADRCSADSLASPR